MGWWTDTKNWSGDRWNDITGVTASRDANRFQQKSINESDQILKDAYGRAEQANLPFLQGGTEDYGTLRGLMAGGQFDMPTEEFKGPSNFTFGAGDMQADPGYQYRLQQGEKGLMRGAAKMGGFASGATLAGLQRHGQEMGSQEFGNAYNRAFDRFQDGRDFNYGAFQDSYSRRSGENMDRFNRRNTLAGFGVQAAGRGMDNATTLGGLLSNNRQAAGNANAMNRVNQYNNQRDTIMGTLKLGTDIAGTMYSGSGGGKK